MDRLCQCSDNLKPMQGRTMKKEYLSLALALIAAAQIFAADGRCVAVAYRESWMNPAVPESFRPDVGGNGLGMEYGAIVKFGISANKAVKVDTILKMTTGMGQYPVWSFDGTRVAFFRWPYKIQNNGLVKDGTSATVAMMDANGGNLKNIVTLPANPGIEASLDWSADGWIYYARPRSDLSGDAIGRTGNEVWKFNPFAADPASTDTKVLNVASCQYVRRYSMNQAGTRCAIQTYPIPGQSCGGDINGPGPIPSGGSFSAQWGVFGSCNAKISSSGDIGGGYAGGYHDVIQLTHWTGSGYQQYDMQSYCIPHASLASAFKWTDFSMASGEPGCELLNFAANSDKWISQTVYWHYPMPRRGTNMFVINWIDNQSFFASKNPDCSGQPNPPLIAYQTVCGDFWVYPPSGQDYSYEDITGQWHSLGKPSGYSRGDTAISGTAVRDCPVAASLNLVSRVSVEGVVNIQAAGLYCVRIADSQGRVVYSRAARSKLTIPSGELKPGVYRVQAIFDNRILTTDLTIAQ